MTEQELYSRADEVVGPYLLGKGFRRGRLAEYIRSLPDGFDRVIVSKGPPSKARSHFSVFMSYYPDYLKPVQEIFGLADEEIGFPAGPYLTPVGASQRPKYWSYKTPEALANSLRHVLQCLEQAGLPWLESLRDRQVFARSVDPIAAIDAGLAHEAAGNFKEARRSYEEMLRRLRLVLETKPSEKIILKEVARPFVFVASKLGVDTELCSELRRKANYHPQITPLPNQHDTH